MPGARVFFDSNFLIYQRDTSHAQKYAEARAWTADLIAAGTETATGWQCLREYYSVITRKKLMLTRADAQNDVRYWASLVPPGDSDDFEQAWSLETSYGLNFFDCLILASALNAGATHILTEDMQHNQVVGGLRIVNPFVAKPVDVGVI